MIISKSQEKRETVEKMTRALQHRGPDHEAYFEDENLVIGHRRLSIIDLSEASNQPMMNERKDLVLVFNGEIYNYKEIRKSIDYSYKSNGDTEVILALYEKYGDEFVEKIDGIFSFCLYDIKRNAVIIARDRFGQKPLYYYAGDDFFMICSEIRPLLKTSFFKPEIDLLSFQEYVQYKTVYTPKTIIKGLKSHSPATYSVIDINRIVKADIAFNLLNEKPYWEINKSNFTYNKDDKKQSEIKVKDLFLASINKRLMADVNLGIFLSGGIDSTAIVGAASALSENKVNTFSVDFEEEGYSEKKYSDLVAEHFNTNHSTLSINEKYFSTHFIEGLNAMDHPSEDGLNNYFVSKLAKDKGVNVVLSGIGGDELFAGYYVFDILRKLNSNSAMWKLPEFIKKSILFYRRTFKPGVITKILSSTFSNKGFDLEESYPLFRRAFDNVELTLNTRNFESSFLKVNDPKNHFISAISVKEMTYYMQDILLRDADIMSMASSLELRAPFLDKDLVEYIIAMPDNIKGYNKKILKNALTDYIPDQIRDRVKKGFVIPIQKWILRDESDWFDKQLSAFFKRHELKLNRQLSKIYSSTLDDNKRYQKFWHLAVLEHWLSVNLDNV